MPVAATPRRAPAREGGHEDRASGDLDVRVDHLPPGVPLRHLDFFYQKFFRCPTSLGVEPEASVVDFARLLQSLGTRLSQADAADAERAYRLSLRLRPDGSLAHAGRALLLERHGRVVEASREARLALEVLDAYAGGAAEREPTVEDITPFRSPLRLREELQHLATPPPRTSH